MYIVKNHNCCTCGLRYEVKTLCSICDKTVHLPQTGCSRWIYVPKNILFFYQLFKRDSCDGFAFVSGDRHPVCTSCGEQKIKDYLSGLDHIQLPILINKPWKEMGVLDIYQAALDQRL